MIFSSKAKNLINLKKLNLKKSTIPNFKSFTLNEIIKNKKEILEDINKNLERKISIRSSFFLEDKENLSMAGEFDGLFNVKNTNKEILRGIDYLSNQYKSKSNNYQIYNESEIIFQNHVSNILLSGVLTNKCIKDGTDYYVINYDDSSNLTNTVTSGGVSGGRVINILKQNSKGLRTKKFKIIIESIKEIEKKISNKALDIEFALDKNGIVNISDGNLSNVNITSSNLTLNVDKWGNYQNGGTITLNGTYNINVSILTGNWEIIEL